jgi:hypothetical protein
LYEEPPRLSRPAQAHHTPRVVSGDAKPLHLPPNGTSRFENPSQATGLREGSTCRTRYQISSGHPSDLRTAEKICFSAAGW